MTILTTAFAALLVNGFTPVEILRWQPQTFRKLQRVEYRLETIEGEARIVAECRKAASGLIRQERIDLTRTPILRWHWRVDKVLENADERKKKGDDYPARIYVVKSGGLLPWRSQAVNYVWSSHQAAGASWPNAYAPDQVRMLAVNGGVEQLGKWQTITRNVMNDFRQLFSVEVKQIDAVALMTDCDDTGQSATARYGAIEFLSPVGYQR